MKRRICEFLLAVTVLCLLLLPVQAVDTERIGSIRVSMTYQGSSVYGGSLKLYRVADVGEHKNVFVYTEDFADCTQSANALSSRQAEELAQIAEEKALSGTIGELGAGGNAYFTELPVGLYLLVQEEPSPGFAPVRPFLVSVPGQQDGAYIYDVDASPKVDLEAEPTEPETDPTEPTKPNDPDLPKTGALLWPVPVLAAAGLVIFCTGWLLHSNKKYKD